ncbi:MAG: hypothetical protein ACYDDF_09170 [Thermoplasmatota archaeon]
MWADFEMYLRYDQRMKPTTISQRRRDLLRMSRHPIFPVKVSGQADEIVDSFCNFAQYREEEEGLAATAVVNDFKAMRLLFRFYGIDAKAKLPRPPPIVAKTKPMLPSPEDIHRLLSWKFFPGDTQRNYENALVQYMLAVSFGLGLRTTSELHALTWSNFDPTTHTLVVEEPKKGSPTRRIYVEPEWMCCAKNVLSLGNFGKWRAKVDPEGHQTAFFLRPDGSPFPSKSAMSQFLWRSVPREVFPWWSPNLGRTWSATARIIEWNHDHYRVAKWLGHEDVKMLRMHYDQDAHLHEKVHGKDWLYRAFYGRPRRGRTPAEASKARVSVLTPRASGNAPVGI